MKRCVPAALVVISLAVAGCTNDYGQFDFASGDPGTPDGPTRDAAKRPRADGSDEDALGEMPGDAPADASSEMTDGPDELPDASDAPSLDGDAAADGADRSDGSVSIDAPDAPQPDAPEILDGGADAPVDEDASADGADGGDGGEAPDVSMGDDGAVDAGADISVMTDAGSGDDAPDGCGPGQKVCHGACVPDDDPATGCASNSCDPCSLPHATARCSLGACAIAVCAAGHDDCDHLPANGCETWLDSDVDNCGTCGRTCGSQGVLSRECAGGVCVSTCTLGLANCSRPASGPDDGCETAVGADFANCGSCGNDCRAQGAGMICGVVAAQCGCADNSQCRVGGSTGSCDKSTGTCKCGPNDCRPGEACKAVQGADQCSCNGGAACSTGQTCCLAPAGCHDLLTDPTSCGACGHACPLGFFCVGGSCACNADSQCQAGSAGTCASGQCVCNGVTCRVGQRCLPGGVCG